MGGLTGPNGSDTTRGDPESPETPAADAPEGAEVEAGDDEDGLGAWASDDEDVPGADQAVDESVDEDGEAAQPEVEDDATEPQQVPAAAPNDLAALKAELAATKSLLHSLRAPQPPPAPAPSTAPPKWSLPHAGNEIVAQAVDVLAQVGPGHEAFTSLPETVKGAALEQAKWLASQWKRYQRNPAELYDDHIAPVLEQSGFAKELKALRREVAELRGERFVAQHSQVLATPQDQQRFVQLAAEMPQDQALKFLAMERELKALKGQAGKVQQKQQQIEANKQASRGQAANTGKGRKGSNKGLVGTTDIKALARIARQREAERGE